MEVILEFTKSPKQAWWHRFIHPEYQHVTVYTRRFDDPNWVLSDWTAYRLDVVALNAGELTYSLSMKQSRIMALEVSEKTYNDVQVFKPGLISCVSHALHVIGCYHWRVVTPWQLMKYITRLGAIDITDRFRRTHNE